VPILARWHALGSAPGTLSQFTLNIDLASTIVEAAGVSQHNPSTAAACCRCCGVIPQDGAATSSSSISPRAQTIKAVLRTALFGIAAGKFVPVRHGRA
jgi:hypothetical protein